MIRVWLETEAAQSFRARMTARLDLEAGQDEVVAAASIEDVIVRVERWLRAFQEGTILPISSRLPADPR